MSAEVVEGPRGELYVVAGSPGRYEVLPVGPRAATFERKYAAVAAIRVGQITRQLAGGERYGDAP